MNMEKLPVILVIALLFSLGSVFASGNEKMERILFEAKELTDEEELLRLAKEGISDLDVSTLEISVESYVIHKKSGEVVKIDDVSNDIVTTTQKLKTIKEKSGKIKDYYVTHFFIGGKKDKKNNVTISSTGSDSDMDATYSVRQYLTMYYYTAVNYGYTYASIYKLEPGFPE